jgi:hypothetical protein
VYYRSLSISGSSTTLSQASRERGSVSAVVNERLAVGQRGENRRLNVQSGRIRIWEGDEARRPARNPWKLRVPSLAASASNRR